MTISANTPYLRQALFIDAAVSAATGLLMAGLASWLAQFLALPAPLLFWAGVVLLPYAGALVFLATRDELPHWTVWSVIALNAMWAADCVLLIASGHLSPNALGTSFVLLQALVVGAFAELQFVALRRSFASRSFA